MPFFVMMGTDENRLAWRLRVVREMIMINVALDAMGVAVVLTLLLGALLSNQMAERRGRFFVLLLVLTCAQHLLDGLNWLCEGKPELSALLFWVNFCIFTAGPVTALVFYHYILSLISAGQEKFRRLSAALLALCVLWLLLNVINVFTSVFYGVDEGGRYFRGPLYALIHVYHFSVMMLGTAIALADREMSARYKLALFTYAFLPFVSLIFQMLFYGLSSLTYCALTLSMLLIYITVHIRSVARLEKTGAELKKTRIAYQETLYDAETDDLTGLLVRKVLMRRVEETLRSGRGAGCALWMLDLDRFKNVNDQFGHPAGDRVLMAVGDKLTALFSQDASIARYGGDEFCVFLPQVKLEELYVLLQHALAALTFSWTDEGTAVDVGASIGAAYLPADRSMTADELLSFADEALYVSKRNGRHQYSLKEL